MALQADVQKLVDEVAENKSLAKSALAGQVLMGGQIADLKAQIGTLSAGSVLSVADLDAIKATATSLDETNTELKGAVPANTTADPAVALPAAEVPLEVPAPVVDPVPPSA